MYSAKQFSFLALILAQLLVAIQCGVYDNTDKWVSSDKTRPFPENAVVTGFDPSGFTNFLGRVVSGANILPARVVAETGVASFNTDTAVGTATAYELLVPANETISYRWIHSYDGLWERNAVCVGTNSANDRVYPCRVKTDGALLGGMLTLSKKCFVRHGTMAMKSFDKYEVLVREFKTVQWMPHV